MHAPRLLQASTRVSTVVAVLAAMCALARPARAQVTQPDGTPIPVDTSTLPMVFSGRGETLNVRTDAAVTPERFVPGCRLTFTLVTRGPALFQNSFGWYNVTGSRPPESDLHVLIPCTAPTGFVATLDLRTEPAYRGGEIGFFLRTPESGPGSRTCSDCCGRAGGPGFTYYTERRFNPDNMGASSYVHLLIYDSRVTRSAFYFAWEDLYGGGDNNFTDFVAQVGNIVCSGAGAECDTGMQGICRAGTQQCVAGMLRCVGTTRPRMEACNGLDDNCNGMVDDGDLCPAGQVCERGVCVGRCVEGGCFPGFTCSPRGTCVETACLSMTCPDGQRCEMGRCVGLCDGVMCPGGQVCRAGRCVDPCAGVMCDEDQVCTNGVCQPLCQCRPCAAGQACRMDGRCVETACAMTMCPAGQRCAGGMCVDACAGAVCPRGERCEMGACVADPTSDAGGSDASLEVGVVDGGRRDSGGGTGSDAGADARMDAGRRDGGLGGDEGACGCRAVGRAGGTSGARAGWLAVVAMAAVVAARRRRARRAG